MRAGVVVSGVPRGSVGKGGGAGALHEGRGGEKTAFRGMRLRRLALLLHRPL